MNDAGEDGERRRGAGGGSAPVEGVEHALEELREVEVREAVLDLRLGPAAEEGAEDEENLNLKWREGRGFGTTTQG